MHSELISGKYRLLRRLAEGGMGEVWSARNVLTNRDFAIKLLLPAFASHPEILHRFLSEARATGQLKHPSLVNVFDAGRTERGRPYLVMELLEGESLEHMLKRRGKLDALTACLFMSQVARGLQVAHDAGIVHRDLSSANIFLVKAVAGGDPIPKILDFGVSKFMNPSIERRVRTGEGAVLGSPEYMSPEQARGAENTDARTDVWSLGILLYEMLTGRVPFGGSTFQATLLAIMNQPHRPLAEVTLAIDAQLSAVVDRCLTKERDERLATAGELAEQLDRIAMRLASRSGDTRFTPRRRATDRVSRVSGLPPVPEVLSPGVVEAGNREPERAVPIVRRCWQFVSKARPPRTVVAAGSALGGTALGIVIGVAWASPQQLLPSNQTNSSVTQPSGRGGYEPGPSEQFPSDQPKLAQLPKTHSSVIGDADERASALAAEPAQRTASKSDPAGDQADGSQLESATHRSAHASDRAEPSSRTSASTGERAPVEHKSATASDRTASEHKSATASDRTASERKSATASDRTASERKSATASDRTASERKSATASDRTASERKSASASEQTTSERKLGPAVAHAARSERKQASASDPARRSDRSPRSRD